MIDCQDVFSSLWASISLLLMVSSPQESGKVAGCPLQVLTIHYWWLRNESWIPLMADCLPLEIVYHNKAPYLIRFTGAWNMGSELIGPDVCHKAWMLAKEPHTLVDVINAQCEGILHRPYVHKQTGQANTTPDWTVWQLHLSSDKRQQHLKARKGFVTRICTLPGWQTPCT